MQTNERWLREWCNPSVDTPSLAAAFTEAGLEVDAIEVLPTLPDGVIVVTVLDVAPHPNADRLRICTVRPGPDAATLSIVCGAPNVRAGMTTALAQIGTTLPGGLTIKAARIRGVDSAGMLCSAQELGLRDEAGGILDLPMLVPGTPLRVALDLGDAVLNLGLTPNRGDCLSVRGLARELSAVTGTPLTGPALIAVESKLDDTVNVRVEDPAGCPRYVCRVLRDVNATAPSPLWLRTRLERAGLRSLGVVVDITNYVLLELGQPLHAFDLEKIRGDIVVRRARPGEALTLLDNSHTTLAPEMLVIADQRGPLAVAGVMGGAASAVTADTRDLLLEAAYFQPSGISLTARRLGRLTDAALRFERGTDPHAQVEAIERTTQLLVELCDAKAGPVVHVHADAHMPAPTVIKLRAERLRRVLGCELDRIWCTRALRSLGITVTEAQEGWVVTPPSWRSDLSLEEDYIEELARLHGYTRLPTEQPAVRKPPDRLAEHAAPEMSLAQTLIARGYQEALTYSFIDADLSHLLDPAHPPLALANPLSAELAVLRTSLWPGLVQAASHNLRRQEARVRLFEVGPRFLATTAGAPPKEGRSLAGLITGARLPEQWGVQAQPADFYDLKADVEALLATVGITDATFVPAVHAALHPGQSAGLQREGSECGILGRLHPSLERQLDLPATWVFELDIDALSSNRLAAFEAVLRLPSVRRDLALLLPQETPADALLSTVREAAGPVLRELVVFDIYAGEGVAPGFKSVGVGLKVADGERTLTDTDVETIVARVLDAAQNRHGARLREAYGTHQG